MLNLTLSRVMICKPFFFLNPLFFAFSASFLPFFEVIPEILYNFVNELKKQQKRNRLFKDI